MFRKYLLPLLSVVLILALGAAATYYIRTLPKDKARSDARVTLATTENQIFTDLYGEPLSLDQFGGKVRVVNSWASWTPFSIQELKDLNALAQEYSEEEVIFIAINRKESKEIARSFLATLGDLYALHFVIDVNDTYYAAVGGYAMPETVFYDAQGNIVFHQRGSLDKEGIRRHIEEALSFDR